MDPTGGEPPGVLRLSGNGCARKRRSPQGRVTHVKKSTGGNPRDTVRTQRPRDAIPASLQGRTAATPSHALIRLAALFAMCACAPTLSHARAAPFAHDDQREPDGIGPTTYQSVTADLEQQAARSTALGYDAQRVAHFDFVLPSTAEEFRATAGSAILLFSVVTNDRNELPLARVYALIGNRVTELRRIAWQSAAQPAPARKPRILGQYREDGFYLLPVGLAAKNGVLLADFATNRQGFTITSLPLATADRIGQFQGVPHGPLDPAATQRFLSREYPGFSVKLLLPDRAPKTTPQ